MKFFIIILNIRIKSNSWVNCSKCDICVLLFLLTSIKHRDHHFISFNGPEGMFCYKLSPRWTMNLSTIIFMYHSHLEWVLGHIASQNMGPGRRTQDPHVKWSWITWGSIESPGNIVSPICTLSIYLSIYHICRSL